jgi:hypothetical protein
VEYIFEAGDKGVGGLLRNAPKMALPVPIFKPSRDTSGEEGLTPLQAADFFAWEVLKVVREVGWGAPASKYRRTFQILSKIPSKWAVIDREALLDSCIKSHIPIRQRA